jgi:predicted RNA-binding protein with TRAM domain
LGEFNKLLRSKEEFCKFKRIKAPSLVWRLWDRGTSPDDHVTITSRELKKADNRTLDQVTIPIFQLKTFREFEDKYHEANEKMSTLKQRSEELERSHADVVSDLEALRSGMEDLRTENKVLKEAPPNIEYKDSPATIKQLEDLEKENEMLKMQVIELEAATRNTTVPISKDRPTKSHPSEIEPFIKRGDRFNVTIEGLGRNGDGFTKLRNYVIFIPDTKIGENLEVEVTKTTRKCGFARPLR